jgi:hypothetical protein
MPYVRNTAFRLFLQRKMQGQGPDPNTTPYTNIPVTTAKIKPHERGGSLKAETANIRYAQSVKCTHCFERSHIPEWGGEE